MAYKALYRRFRPQIFEDVVGQGPVTTTLKNQIRSSNISHAYLFSGTRGTGKTSTAKIFARAVNCLNPQDFNPCNVCEVCRGILTENIMDVIEIDAASNNGVDHIRELRENVKYPPSKGRYKVYIIDEVHMLSSGAFNALLKTLEEPPNHIIFILATTDPQKLPPTILSRCQRFEFKAVTTEDMVERLKTIGAELEVTIEEEALRTIANNAGGALRDALSILEQCIAFNEGKVTYEDVVDTLGIVNYEILFNLVQYIADKNISQAIGLVQDIIGEGKDVHQLIKDLINHYRNLMMAKIEVPLETLLSLSSEVLKKIKDQSNLFSVEDMTRAIHILSEVEVKAKYAHQPRILLEVAIVSLCENREKDLLKELREKVNQLENMIKKGIVKEQIQETKAVEIRRETKPIQKEAELQEKQLPQSEGIEPYKEVNYLEIKNKWNEIKDFIRKDKKAQIEAMLKEGELVDIRKNTLIISFKEGYGFHRDTLDREKNREYIAEVIEKVTGQKLKLSMVMEDEILQGKGESEEENFIEKLKKSVPEGILEIYDE
ncbi:DNA polymerase III subunit gamma/tau [Clostridium formicaceticum]|uniref:DNA-directed DNA polymerase n=1 Tax=Clostridium formicaceticum TaxID=1497 RepID=A0AAC9RQQ2_9CLOT|nr:DNA polymerase III subunit gamma/tau [Clostridium formicaceticum]AOY75397.1 DNA polymerase III subunit gamma/tau [Clostridium formicaceticum]ARE89852.1 DNA polymerase III subunit tau [Clostridium formicaceticum]